MKRKIHIKITVQIDDFLTESVVNTEDFRDFNSFKSMLFNTTSSVSSNVKDLDILHNPQ